LQQRQRYGVDELFENDEHVRYVDTAKYAAWIDPQTIPVMYPDGPESAKTVYYGNAETMLQISQSIAMTLLDMDGHKGGWFFSRHPADVGGFRRQANNLGRLIVILLVGAVVFVVVQK